jgi:hypothetical protein
MNQQDITKILQAISTDKPFRAAFGVVAEDIVDKVYSYFTNPNCSCKSDIVNWINKNEDKTNELINRFKETLDTLQQTPTQTKHVSSPPMQPPNAPPMNMKIGETLVIEPSPEAYKKLFTTIKSEHWIFRGIQVIPGEENGKEVWFILFY